MPTPTPPIADLIDLTGRTALVTGGAQGIGEGIAYRLAEAGARVVIADLDGEAAQSAAKHLLHLGYTASAVRADVAEEESVRAMVDHAVTSFGRIDILVNNAGIFPSIPMARMSSAEFDRVLAVNLRGVFLCTTAVSRRMIDHARGGRIINITSIDALHPSGVGLAHYDASKHGVWGFTKNIALELAAHRIWVNAIAPGAVDTPGVNAGLAAGTDVAAVLEAFRGRIPMRRLGVPDDIARVALFLASDLASYLTGAQIVVDGGVLLT
jgi:2-deoxy-D-gluconate 3-dehydrogenase